MKWKKKVYKVGTIRVKTAFLFFPKMLSPQFAPNLGSGVRSDDLEGRWLEKASWAQVYTSSETIGSMSEKKKSSRKYWKDYYWIDDQETE